MNGVAQVEIVSVAHFGKTLRRLIDHTHMQDLEFCKRASISADTLYRHMRMDKPAGNKSTYRAMADALSLTPEQLDAAWKDPQTVEKDGALSAPENTKGGTMQELPHFVNWFKNLSPDDRHAVQAMLDQYAGTPPRRARKTA